MQITNYVGPDTNTGSGTKAHVTSSPEPILDSDKKYGTQMPAPVYSLQSSLSFASSAATPDLRLVMPSVNSPCSSGGLPSCTATSQPLDPHCLATQTLHTSRHLCESDATAHLADKCHTYINLIERGPTHAINFETSDLIMRGSGYHFPEYLNLRRYC